MCYRSGGVQTQIREWSLAHQESRAKENVQENEKKEENVKEIAHDHFLFKWKTSII